MSSTTTDLARGMHRERALLEDYQFLRDAGVIHDVALARLGVSTDEWAKIANRLASRERRSR